MNEYKTAKCRPIEKDDFQSMKGDSALYQEFVYRPPNYPGPIAIDMNPSKECKEYHENSTICFGIDDKWIERLMKTHPPAIEAGNETER